MFSMHSPITLTERWMQALSVRTHTHAPYIIIQTQQDVVTHSSVSQRQDSVSHLLMSQWI